MEYSDKILNEFEDSMVCEFAFRLGKINEVENLAESFRETVEEVGCFCF